MIPLYRLVRIVKSNLGTGGVLLNHDLIPICNTIERKWVGNERNVSCIPTGLYLAHRRVRHFGSLNSYEVFELEDVKGRTLIQIHRANKPSELLGCIALVTNWWKEEGVAGLRSRGAYDSFMEDLEGIDRIALLVTEACVQARDISTMITNLG